MHRGSIVRTFRCHGKLHGSMCSMHRTIPTRKRKHQVSTFIYSATIDAVLCAYFLDAKESFVENSSHFFRSTSRPSGYDQMPSLMSTDAKRYCCARRTIEATNVYHQFTNKMLEMICASLQWQRNPMAPRRATSVPSLGV